MNKDIFSENIRDITAEASAWIAQLETGDLSEADLEALREWMLRSPRHAAEIRRLANLSMELNVLTEFSEALHEVRENYHPVLKSNRDRPIFGSFGVIGLVVVLTIVLSLVFYISNRKIEFESPVLVSTSIGDYRDIELSDGSLVKLNTNSQIEIAYNKQSRRVRLVKGEAYFDVLSNSDRPFLVYAGERAVRAVGTAFTVRLIGEEFGVTVEEGKVELAETRANIVTKSIHNSVDPDIQFESQVILNAGQSITVLPAQNEIPVTTMSKRQLQRKLSWKNGFHDFSNTPLEEVVKEISRYSPMQIEITDPAIRELKFGGIFRIGETQPLLDTIESEFGINVTYIDDKKIKFSFAEQQ